MMRMIGVVVIAIAVVLLGACGKPKPAAEIAATQASLGGTVDLHVGQTLVLKLDENPTTGYQWRCTWAPEAALKLVDSSYQQPGPAVPGAGGVHTFWLRGLQSGEATVTLQYGRWWEGGERQAPQKLTVRVVAQ